MNRYRRNRQNGYALLFMVIALMGIGGVVIAGFTQDARLESDRQKHLHNQRVLLEAKQALLNYAYNYPVTSNNVQGPGRLPCTDVDNDGNSDTNFALCNILGRLPWAEPALNLYDMRDADGQRLWYAVSNRFSTNGLNVPVNSDPAVTFGTITLRDQSGNPVFDASAGGSGIAAIIIAPGAPTTRNGVFQDRSIANGNDPFDTNPDTDPGIVNANRYLDQIVGVEDNSTFVQGGNDGFIPGPIDAQGASEILINDQMIFITAAELIEVAEKSTLQAYRDAITNYRDNIATDVYPWLDDYAGTNLAVYEGDVGTRFGRVPSMFGEYFVNTNPTDSQPISSDLTISLTITSFSADPMVETIAASVAPDIFFRQNGNLVTSFNSPRSFVRYYWDGHDTNLPSSPADGVWEDCPVVFGTEDDCNQDGANNFIGGTTSVDWMKVRRVTVTINSGVSPFEFGFGDLQANPLVFSPPDGADHARVAARYGDSGYLTIAWSQDDDFQASFAETPLGNNGNFVFNALNDVFSVELDYYPALPQWALTANDDWHNSMQFAYASAFQPSVGGACVPGTDCLILTNSAGIQNDKVAVLTLAADHGLIDAGAAGYVDDLPTIFDLENDDIDDIFDLRALNGNDKILVIR